MFLKQAFHPNFRDNRWILRFPTISGSDKRGNILVSTKTSPGSVNSGSSALEEISWVNLDSLEDVVGTSFLSQEDGATLGLGREELRELGQKLFSMAVFRCEMNGPNSGLGLNREARLCEA